MEFPKWADAPKMKKADRASGRLRYLLMTLALTHTGKNSVRALSTIVGLNHSTLSKYIKQGFFTEKAAAQVQLRIGFSAAFLMDPLSIPNTPG